MSKPNKFDSVIGAVKARVGKPAETTEAPSEVPPDTPPAPRPPGRPKGKRSNPDVLQVTAYVDADLYYKVTDALRIERREAKRVKGKGRDFSGLVEQLLRQWYDPEG